MALFPVFPASAQNAQSKDGGSGCMPQQFVVQDTQHWTTLFHICRGCHLKHQSWSFAGTVPQCTERRLPLSRKLCASCTPCKRAGPRWLQPLRTWIQSRAAAAGTAKPLATHLSNAMSQVVKSSRFPISTGFSCAFSLTVICTCSGTQGGRNLAIQVKARTCTTMGLALTV